MTEIWKDAKGYEGLYKISNHGEVWSERKQRLLKKGKSATGYYKVVLYKNKKHKNFDIHRLVAINFINNPLEKPCVNHMDENKTNNHYSNLEWCTYKENNNHARNLKLYPILKSEKSPKSKLCLNDVLNIRKYCSNNIKERKEFAKKYNVSQRTIYDVLVFRTWKECDSHEG